MLAFLRRVLEVFVMRQLVGQNCGHLVLVKTRDERVCDNDRRVASRRERNRIGERPATQFT